VPLCIKTRVHRTIYTSITTQSYRSPTIDHQPRNTGTFADHVQGLPEWSRQMLGLITWVHDFDFVFRVMTNMPDNLSLLVVSDGSAYEGQHMSFGVTIGLMDGRILVEMMGQASGSQSPHRAECTGCLAGAVFCAEMRRFTGVAFSSLNIIAVSDNQGMIRSLRDRSSYDKVYPNSTLRPDWDLLEDIVRQYQTIDLRSITFEWEKEGHQDEFDSHQELSTQARFNIRSKKLASMYTQQHGMSLIPMTPLYLSTRCQLIINGATITGNYRNTLRLASTETPLFEYLLTKHRWDDAVIDMIDWDSFCIAARNYSSTEVHFLKLVHDKLPLCRQVSQHQDWTQSECYYCSMPDTMDHLQQGKCNPASFRYRIDLQALVQQYLKQRWCPEVLVDMFSSALETWVGNDVQVEPATDSVTNKAKLRGDFSHEDSSPGNGACFSATTDRTHPATTIVRCKLQKSIQLKQWRDLSKSCGNVLGACGWTTWPRCTTRKQKHNLQ
jgi:hypothetical protein